MVCKFKNITKIGPCLLLLLLLWSSTGKVYAQTKNYTYQALFLYKFTNQVTWPKDARYGSKFRIGILGDKYVYRLMNNFLYNKKVDGVEVEVIRYTNVFQVRPCHVLFISESNSLNLKLVFARLKNTHCLVMSEKKDLFKKPELFPILSKESGINLKIVNKKLRFDLNKPGIHARGLRLDSDPDKPSLETLAKYDSLRKAVPKKVARSQKSIQELLNKSKALDDSLNTLKTDLQKLIAQEQQYLNSIKNANEKITSLEATQKDRNGKINKLQTRINELERSIAEKNDKITKEVAEIAQLESEINRLAAKLGTDTENRQLLATTNFFYNELKKAGVNVNESLKRVKGYQSIQNKLEKENKKFDAIQERYRADSIRAKNRQDSLIAQQKIQDETQKAKLAEKEKTLAEQKAEVSRHRSNIIVASLVGLILLILLMFFYFSSRRRKKTIEQLNAINAELNQSKQEIEEKNVVLQRNIVELKKKKELEIANRKLEEANQKLDQLQKYKEKLTGMIVHDLKNPLGAVLVNSKMAFDNYAIDPKIKKRLQDIHRASSKIKVYIEDMLAIQTFANSELPLNKTKNKVHKSVKNAVNILRSAIKEKSLIIENNIPEEYYAEYDIKYIGRVYENLLSNAIKYTEAGGKIVFSADLVPGDEQNPLGFVHFAIADSGTGIPEDKFKEIFEPFMQLEAREFANTSSTGIGLTFCKMAVESHGSQIEVTSEVGVGTTFAFDLPRVEAPQTTQEKEETIVTPVSEETQVDENDTTIALSDKEREALQPLIQELDKVEFYEVTTLLAILQKLEEKEEKNSPSLNQWKTAMEESIDNFNEIEYKKLKSLV